MENIPINNSIEIKSEKTNDSESRCEDWIKLQSSLEPKPYFSVDLNESFEVENDVPSFPSNKVKRNSKNISVYFTCEWRNCLQGFETEDDFCRHVEKHLTQMQPTKAQYCCEWDLCYFHTGSNEEIARHVFYHIYHTVLKTIGESICQESKMPPCTNDSRTRNVVPELKNDFICLWDNCGKNYKSVLSYHKHVKLHCQFDYNRGTGYSKHKRELYSCKWEGCKLKFTVVYRLAEHISKHIKEKTVGCHHCGGLFRSNTILLKHCKRQLANNSQEYQCAECFKYFSTEQLLRQHVISHVNCRKCTLCNMTCNNQHSLSKHIRYRHLKERPFKCMSCDKGFVCKADLERHTTRIHEGKVYHCVENGCNYFCKAIYLLKRHDSEVHGNNPHIYACHCCDKIYRTGKTLSKHLINVHEFQLPPGHSRFFYRMDESGLFRLQTMRMESLEVTKEILSPLISKNTTSTEVNDYKDFDLSVTSDIKEEKVLVSISDA